jgi:hypothetical protein
MAAHIIPVVRRILPDRTWDRMATRQFASGAGPSGASNAPATSAS